jgi:transcriptional regulator with XRE-family HTH domain
MNLRCPAMPGDDHLRVLLVGIGATLRKMRRRRRWPQAELARRSGVDRHHISELERAVGGGDVMLSTLVGLAVALDEPLDSFLASGIREAERQAARLVAAPIPLAGRAAPEPPPLDRQPPP